jgi:hypothetical protein
MKHNESVARLKAGNQIRPRPMPQPVGRVGLPRHSIKDRKKSLAAHVQGMRLAVLANPPPSGIERFLNLGSEFGFLVCGLAYGGS